MSASSSPLSWEDISTQLDLNCFAGQPLMRSFRLNTAGNCARDTLSSYNVGFQTPCTDVNAYYWPTIHRSDTGAKYQVQWYCNTGRMDPTTQQLRAPLRLDRREGEDQLWNGIYIYRSFTDSSNGDILSALGATPAGYICTRFVWQQPMLAALIEEMNLALLAAPQRKLQYVVSTGHYQCLLPGEPRMAEEKKDVPPPPVEDRSWDSIAAELGVHAFRASTMNINGNWARDDLEDDRHRDHQTASCHTVQTQYVPVLCEERVVIWCKPAVFRGNRDPIMLDEHAGVCSGIYMHRKYEEPYTPNIFTYSRTTPPGYICTRVIRGDLEKELKRFMGGDRWNPLDSPLVDNPAFDSLSHDVYEVREEKKKEEEEAEPPAKRARVEPKTMADTRKSALDASIQALMDRQATLAIERTEVEDKLKEAVDALVAEEELNCYACHTLSHVGVVRCGNDKCVKLICYNCWLSWLKVELGKMSDIPLVLDPMQLRIAIPPFECPCCKRPHLAVVVPDDVSRARAKRYAQWKSTVSDPEPFLYGFDTDIEWFEEARHPFVASVRGRTLVGDLVPDKGQHSMFVTWAKEVSKLVLACNALLHDGAVWECPYRKPSRFHLSNIVNYVKAEARAIVVLQDRPAGADIMHHLCKYWLRSVMNMYYPGTAKVVSMIDLQVMYDGIRVDLVLEAFSRQPYQWASKTEARLALVGLANHIHNRQAEEEADSEEDGDEDGDE